AHEHEVHVAVRLVLARAVHADQRTDRLGVARKELVVAGMMDKAPHNHATEEHRQRRRERDRDPRSRAAAGRRGRGRRHWWRGPRAGHRGRRGRRFERRFAERLSSREVWRFGRRWRVVSHEWWLLVRSRASRQPATRVPTTTTRYLSVVEPSCRTVAACPTPTVTSPRPTRACARGPPR